MNRLDCGHHPSEHSEITTGYGSDAAGKTYCYDCCTENDKELLLGNVKFVGYLSGDGKSFTNWTGRKLGIVTRMSSSQVNGFGHMQTRYYVRVTDCHGNRWYGTSPGPGMFCRLRKTRTA